MGELCNDSKSTDCVLATQYIFDNGVMTLNGCFTFVIKIVWLSQGTWSDYAKEDGPASRGGGA